MNRRKAANKKAHANKTAHWLAMAKTNVQERVKILQQGWGTMGLIERGGRLRELIGLGCSTRGLERELARSSTTIRRDIELAELPEQDRKAIDAGASAKKILKKKADDADLKRRLERVSLDRKTGAVSDDVASKILDFCRAKDGPARTSVAGEDAEKLLNQTRTDLYKSDAAGYRVVWVSGRRGVKGLFDRTRPSQGKDDFWMAYQAEWLANIVWALAPERLIWESAMDKAQHRISELKPERKTPSAEARDRARWVAELPFYVPVRRIVHGAADHLQRQGRPDRH